MLVWTPFSIKKKKNDTISNSNNFSILAAAIETNLCSPPLQKKQKGCHWGILNKKSGTPWGRVSYCKLGMVSKSGVGTFREGIEWKRLAI